MSALKRKNGPEAIKAQKDNPAKRKKTDTPEKKHAKAAKTDKTKEAIVSNSQPPKSSVLSILKDEEPMFPRGGANILTPLEQKQIQMKAKADAHDEDELEVTSKPKNKKKKEKTSRKSDKQSSHPVRGEDSVRVESLNFKRLAKGSLVLGQIIAINPLDIEVALPNNLTGRVSITAVSDALTARLENLESGSNDDDEEESEDQDVSLASLFTVGQYVRACVLSTAEEPNPAKQTKPKRRIELSLRPSDTNPELSSDDVVTSTSLMASVVSVEDHGCIMDIGLQGLNITGFLPTKEIDASIRKDQLQPGNVFLCLVTGKSPNKRVVQLTTLTEKLGSLKAVPYDATTINTFLPGSVVEVLVSETTWGGVVGKVLGNLDVTADLFHSGVATESADLESVYKVGSKIKGRVICNFVTSKDPKLGISLLPHILSLTQKTTAGSKKASKAPLEALPISSIVEKCVVKKVENDIGLFVEVGLREFRGCVHISRVQDGKVEALYETSGPYKVDTVHRGRILGYNPIDGMFQLSFEKSVLDKKFLRLEDVPIGAVVSCNVESVVVGGEGVKGLIVKLEDGITGFITDRHLSDVQLQHPEKKFREGMTVKARVLSVDPRLRQMRLTLKKTLVNSDAPVIKSFEDVSVGMQVPGTITKVTPSGASIQFYGNLRAFLPRSEMSEAFIRDPAEHFRAGQVVSLHIIEVDPEKNRLIVSCKDPSSFSVEKQAALQQIEIGDIVSGKVTEKTEDIIVELEGSGLRATLPVGHLSDKSVKKCQSELKRIRVGATLGGLMVIDKHDRRRAIALTRKPSLIEAEKQGKLLRDASAAKVGDVLAGYVRDVIPAGVLVQFAGSTRALLPKARIPADDLEKHDFGMSKLQSLSVKIVSVIQDQGRLVVALASSEDTASAKAELAIGSVTTATVASVRDTQLNVRLGEGQHGRIDMSELFDKYEDIEDPKQPLASYKQGDEITVRVLGTHDARNHRFLPISHRGNAHQVLELTAKPSDLKAGDVEPLTIEKVEVGSEHLAFVNTAADKYVWVNLSPFVRSRLNSVDITDDLSALADIPGNFPVGSVLKVQVTSVNAETGRVDVSASRLSSTSKSTLSWNDLKTNDILPVRVTKANERQIVVQLSNDLAGPVHLPDIADNYDEAKPANFKKNDIIKVSVVEVDKSNKRFRLSTRPSRILNSAAKVVDKEITSVSQVSTGDVVRGFIKSVSDVGVFVLLGGSVVGHVKIANLSDKFLKKWKDEFQVDQLVKARVLSVDETTGRIDLSLKESAVEKDYVPLKTLHDIKEGQILTGKVRKVEPFGAFIEVDHSANVRGLCHRSEMAETTVADPQKLYSEGDAVKVYVLMVDIEKRRVNFSLKPSHFDSESDSEDSDLDMEDVADDREPVDDEMEDVSTGGALLISGPGGDESDSDEDEENDEGGAKLGGLGSKYDWTADAFGNAAASEDDDPSTNAKEARKTRKKARIEVDKTAELDVNGPQSATDYERLLMGQPDSSELWIAYMALQMQVSELSKAREIAERALRTINIREQNEKLNVWIAYLNLEMAYGNKETLDEVFKRACQYNDEQEVHERLASIYIRTGKHKEADALFQKMVKKFGAKAPQLWLNYAHFLSITCSDPTRARALLPRAHQSLDTKHHLPTSVRFAALEWRSPSGDAEKGRTFFEGILAKYPKKGDIWRQLLDLEIGANADEGVIRDVFERRVKVSGLKPLQAKKWFEKWADWEEGKRKGGKEEIMRRAGKWVRAYKARQAAKAEADEEEEEE